MGRRTLWTLAVVGEAADAELNSSNPTHPIKAAPAKRDRAIPLRQFVDGIGLPAQYIRHRQQQDFLFLVWE